MDSTEFGKDLGLMHELIVTGRRVGFGRVEWANLAHREQLMRKTLDFVRLQDASHFPLTLERDEKIERLAQLIILLAPFLTDNHWCIDCEHNVGKGKKNGKHLLNGFAKLGMQIPDFAKGVLKQGGCFQPFRTLFPILGEALGVELALRDAKEVFPKSGLQHLTMSCVATSCTSVTNIFLLKEILAKEKVTLEIEVKFPHMPTL